LRRGSARPPGTLKVDGSADTAPWRRGAGPLCSTTDGEVGEIGRRLGPPWRRSAPKVCRPTIANHLIALLPLTDQRRLLAHCEHVQLALFTAMQKAGTPTTHAWFPDTAFISLLTQPPDTQPLEVGLVGSEGMLGTQLVLGVQEAPLQALVQGAGLAWRIGRVPLRRELARSDALRRVLLRYVQVQLLQLATGAACLRFHAIQPRLARWLLMTQDRAGSSDFRITHEFLSTMLGVRRVGITQAAQGLQRAGLILYRRGQLGVLDRPGLLRAACSCYAADNASFARLMQLRRPERGPADDMA
jgi:CRP-like cAMP-binding protein